MRLGSLIQSSPADYKITRRSIHVHKETSTSNGSTIHSFIEFCEPASFKRAFKLRLDGIHITGMSSILSEELFQLNNARASTTFCASTSSSLVINPTPPGLGQSTHPVEGMVRKAVSAITSSTSKKVLHLSGPRRQPVCGRDLHMIITVCDSRRDKRVDIKEIFKDVCGEMYVHQLASSKYAHNTEYQSQCLQIPFLSLSLSI